MANAKFVNINKNNFFLYSKTFLSVNVFRLKSDVLLIRVWSPKHTQRLYSAFCTYVYGLRSVGAYYKLHCFILLHSIYSVALYLLLPWIYLASIRCTTRYIMMHHRRKYKNNTTIVYNNMRNARAYAAPHTELDTVAHLFTFRRHRILTTCLP